MKEPPAHGPVVLPVEEVLLSKGFRRNLCSWTVAEALATFVAELLAFSKTIF
jgi:hypothetical protein